MIRFIYNLFFPLGLLFILPGYLAKMVRRGNYRHKFGQRLGFYDREVQEKLKDGRNTWIHAVSVGEVNIALKLAERMKQLEPRFRCVLSTTTTTGNFVASKTASDWLEVIYCPLDFWPITRRAFNMIRPTRIVLVEAEVWPNLVTEAHLRRIPISLVNARLSSRSERKFRRFKFFVAPIFQLLDAVCVQEPEDVQRWEALGVAPDRIKLVGSIKFDSETAAPDPEIPREVLHRLEIAPDRPVFLAGSTHDGEEKIAAEVLLGLREQHPDLFLVIAPRHAERSAEIQRALTRLGLRVALRTDAAITPFRVPQPDCVILDAMGELRHWYAAGTVTFVGKSLSARGGQNPAEAIAARRPIIFGPHMENFEALARDLLVSGGAIQVADAAELRTAVASLLGDAAARERLVANAEKALSAHLGATTRTAKLIVDLK